MTAPLRSEDDSCEAFDLRLNELLDERLDPRGDQALSDHAAACAACARHLRIHGQMLGAFQPSRAAAPAHPWAKRIADLHTRDLAVAPASHSPQRGTASRRRLRPATWLVLLTMSAAAVAIAITLQATLGPRGGPAPDLAKTKPVPPPRGPVVPTSPAGSALAVGTPHAPAHWDEYEKAIEAWGNALDPEGSRRESFESSVEPFADSIRPIGISFTTVIGGLRKTLPATRAPRRARMDQGAFLFVDRPLAA